MAGVLIPWSYKYLKGAYKKLSGKEIPMYIGIILFVILLVIFAATSTPTVQTSPNTPQPAPTGKKEVTENIPVLQSRVANTHIYTNLIDRKIPDLEKEF